MRAVVLAGLVAAGALAPQGTPQPVPRFRAGVDVVVLDVSVLDRDRRPVRGLTAEDFTILEEGRPQPIVSFDELDAPEPDGSLVPWMRDVAPDVRTNTDDHRRIVLLILDDATIGFRYRDSVRSIGRAIVDQLGPADQAAVVYTADNRKSQDFTSDRRVLRSVVERYVDTSMPPQLRANYAIGTVRRAVQGLIDIPHRRKALIFVSSVGLGLIASGNLGIGLMGGMAEEAAADRDRLRDIGDMVYHAQRSNVTVYTVNPAGLETPLQPRADAGVEPGPDLRLETGPDATVETLRTISNATGGFAVVNTNTFDAGIRQIFRETGSYYLLGFRSAHTDGRFRRVRVEVSRPGVTVRTRSGYEARRPEQEPRPAKAGETPLPLVKALSTLLPNPDMPMRVSVAPFAVPGRDAAALSIVLGLRQPVPRDTRVVEKIDLISTAFNNDGRARQGRRQTVHLTLRPVDADDARYEILSQLELKPGRYNLRFAIHSGSLDRSGSVYQEVEIPDFRKSPLSLSGVVLSVEPALPSAPRGFLASIVPVEPTTQRSFVRGDVATAFLRVYQGGRKPPAPTVVTSEIINDEDRAVHTAEDTLTAGQFEPTRGADYRLAVPIDRLPPGSYLLRVVARAGPQSAGRDVRFFVRTPPVADR
jgi:VWFA-related protein